MVVFGRRGSVEGGGSWRLGGQGERERGKVRMDGCMRGKEGRGRRSDGHFGFCFALPLALDFSLVAGGGGEC